MLACSTPLSQPLIGGALEEDEAGQGFVVAAGFHLFKRGASGAELAFGVIAGAAGLDGDAADGGDDLVGCECLFVVGEPLNAVAPVFQPLGQLLLGACGAIGFVDSVEGCGGFQLHLLSLIHI